jgi:hypothetical protein
LKEKTALADELEQAKSQLHRMAEEKGGEKAEVRNASYMHDGCSAQIGVLVCYLMRMCVSFRCDRP